MDLAAGTASGLTEIEVIPRRTRCSANSGRMNGACPHSEEIPACVQALIIHRGDVSVGGDHVVPLRISIPTVALVQLGAERPKTCHVPPKSCLVTRIFWRAGDPVDARGPCVKVFDRGGVF